VGWQIRLNEKGGMQHSMPCHTPAEALHAYVAAAGIGEQRKGELFRIDRGHAATVLSDRPLRRPDAWPMIRRRAAAAGIMAPIGNHSFRATGITAYLANGGALEHAQAMAAHESPRTTKLYDRTKERLTQNNEVEKIRLRARPLARPSSKAVRACGQFLPFPSREIIRRYNNRSVCIKRNIKSAIDHIIDSADMIQRCLEKAKLLRSSYRRHQENNTGVQLDVAVSAAKLDRVVGHQHPVLLGDDLQQFPVSLRAQAKVIDMHRLEPSLARRLDQGGRQVLVDEKARDCYTPRYLPSPLATALLRQGGAFGLPRFGCARA
jgi:hypothetical protein